MIGATGPTGPGTDEIALALIGFFFALAVGGLFVSVIATGLRWLQERRQ